MRPTTIVAAAIMPTVALACAAHAEGTWTLGVFAHGETGAYVGHEDQAELLPYLSFETDRFEFSLHDGIAFHALEREGPQGGVARLSFVLTPRWQPNFSDDPIFDDLDRDTAVELGMRGVYESGPFFVEAEALADVSDTHDGYAANASVGMQYDLGALSLSGSVGARYRSGDLNQHLFGVSASEATATRAAYDPGASSTGFASISAVYVLSDTVALVGDITFEDLGEMEDSPLVDKGSNTSLALGVVYQF